MKWWQRLLGFEAVPADAGGVAVRVAEPDDVRVFKIHSTGPGMAIQFQHYPDRVYGFVPIDLLGADLRRPLPGDLLTSSMASGRTGVFRFTETEWCSDPYDMFTGTVEPVGYDDEPDGRAALDAASGRPT